MAREAARGEWKKSGIEKETETWAKREREAS